MTPRRAIRQYCLDCCLGSASEVAQCANTACILWPYRSGHRGPGQALSPLKAIRAYCLACGEPGSFASVRECKIHNCALHQYRFGHDPQRKKAAQKMPKMGQVNRFIEGVQACPEAGEYKTMAGQFGIEKNAVLQGGNDND